MIKKHVHGRSNVLELSFHYGSRAIGVFESLDKLLFEPNRKLRWRDWTSLNFLTWQLLYLISDLSCFLMTVASQNRKKKKKNVTSGQLQQMTPMNHSDLEAIRKVNIMQTMRENSWEVKSREAFVSFWLVDWISWPRTVRTSLFTIDIVLRKCRIKASIRQSVAKSYFLSVSVIINPNSHNYKVLRTQKKMFSQFSCSPGNNDPVRGHVVLSLFPYPILT